MTRRWRITVEWKLADLWIGVFWKRSDYALDIWACLVPCLPIHLTWWWPQTECRCSREAWERVLHLPWCARNTNTSGGIEWREAAK